MPRSQGIPYEIHPSPKKDEKGLPLLYVRPLKRNKVSMEGIPSLFPPVIDSNGGIAIEAGVAGFEDICVEMTLRLHTDDVVP